MTNRPLLIGDIGGSNARFALAKTQSPGYEAEQTFSCADYETAEATIQAYLDIVGAPPPRAICLAVAGPIVDQQVRLTNNSWTIAASNLQDVFGATSVHLLNDFEAIAYSVPLLSGTELMPIGPLQAKPLISDGFVIGVIGPGTGLGIAGLRKRGGHCVAVATEAGHAGFAPETSQQSSILAELRERFGRVSAERLVSGPGLQNLYWAVCRIHADEPANLGAAKIFAAATIDGDPRAAEAIEIFFEILGQVAGDLALSLGVEDGIFVAGGIAQRHPELLANSRFRLGFENKGRYRAKMERLSTQLILHEQPGLLGASFCARQQINA